MSPLEREEFEAEIETHNRFLVAAGANDLVFITHAGAAEIGVYSLITHKVEWFLDFSDATAYCKQQVPDANWEETGW